MSSIIDTVGEMEDVIGKTTSLSGIIVDFQNPTPEMFTISDIATGLAMMTRYGGQLHTFYSVAEHCLRVAANVPPEYSLEALLHDAPEAFMGDMTRPLKYLDEMTPFRVLERRMQDAINTRYSLKTDEERWSVIKKVDDRIGSLEADEMKHNFTRIGMYPNEAKRMFIAAFEQYATERGLYEIYKKTGAAS